MKIREREREIKKEREREREGEKVGEKVGEKDRKSMGERRYNKKNAINKGGVDSFNTEEGRKEGNQGCKKEEDKEIDR